MKTPKDTKLLRVLFSEDQIRRRVEDLARQISSDYADKGEVLLVGVLKGAFIFLADLCRRMTVPRRVDFIAVSSYGDRTVSSGNVRLVLDLRGDIRGRHVLVVEDIVDTGSTLAYLLDLLRLRGPASVRTCAFLRKEKGGPPVDYVGFEVADEWVVGYGLDYADDYRTLPHIAILQVNR
ncbi:MAG: hypoxanthine phosphoribosyltransferase [Planctomycetes bacterium]|nr:hypoxanthine phosphoribosyltransferase [Planctomycetota bacterium]